VHQDLASDPTRYDNLSACDNRLDHALSLWPENPEARWLRFRLLFRFAQVAMAHGDIQLARIQAERMPPSPERDELLAEVSVFEKLKDREQLEAETAELERRLAVANALRLRTHLSGAAEVMERLASANPCGDEGLASLIRDAQKWLQAKQSE
jgi:hypothetical protein